MEQNYFLRWMGGVAFACGVWILFPFLKSFCVALLLAMASLPLHHLVELKLERNDFLKSISAVTAAAIVTLGLSLILFLPLVIFFFHLLDQPANTMQTIRLVGNSIDTLTTHLPSYLAWLKDPLDSLLEIAKAHKNEIITYLAGWFGNGLKILMLMLGEMTMIVVFFFFLIWYGRRLTLFLVPIIPLTRAIKREFMEEMIMTTAVVFYTLLGVVIAQGLAFGVFIAFFEGYNPLLLGFLAGISGIIPVFGTALVWVPVAINEYLQGHTLNVIIISFYSWAMMAFFIDNFLKLIILNFVNRTLSTGKNRINEFVIFFAIVGGLATFGFWGFLLGPAIIAFVVTTLRTLRKAHRSIRH
ncbi:MAG: AI-2E family transporter [Sulfuricurvum sp.]|nr:AI-2E family transporter [Sulfuricurvum sp.]